MRFFCIVRNTGFVCAAFFALTCKSRVSATAKVKQAENRMTGFDVNDLSVMFPMPKTKKELGNLLKADQPLKDGTLIWDKTAFTELVRQADQRTSNEVMTDVDGKDVSMRGPGIQFQNTRFEKRGGRDIQKNWKVVSFRFDPCAPSDLPLKVDPLTQEKMLDERCLTQIRLILQPILVNEFPRDPNDEFFTELDVDDFAAHLIFGFPTSEAKNIAKKLLALKSDVSTGKMLGVHPALIKKERPKEIVSFGLDADPAAGRENEAAEEMAKKMRLFLVNELSAKNLQAVSFMGTLDFSEPWTFFGGKVVHDASGKVTGFKFLPQKFGEKIVAEQSVGFLSEGPDPVSPNFGGTRPEISSFLTRDKLKEASLLTDPLRRQSGADTLAEIENPEHSALLLGDQTNPKHRDCVSCHLSTSLVLPLFHDSETGVYNPNLAEVFVKSNKRFSLAKDPKYAGITGYMDSKIMSAQAWELRNFGYIELDKPGVSMRTLNETIIATAKTNELLGLSNPAPQVKCDDLKVWTCLLNRENPGNCFETECTVDQAESKPFVTQDVQPEPKFQIAAPVVSGGRCVVKADMPVTNDAGAGVGVVTKGTSVSAMGLVAKSGPNKGKMAIRTKNIKVSNAPFEERFLDPMACQDGR